jgi:hypothetical protein
MLTASDLPEPLFFSVGLHKLPFQHFTNEFVQVKRSKTPDVLAGFLSPCKPMGIDLCAHTNRPKGQWTSRYLALSIKPWFELQRLQ